MYAALPAPEGPTRQDCPPNYVPGAMARKNMRCSVICRREKSRNNALSKVRKYINSLWQLILLEVMVPLVRRTRRVPAQATGHNSLVCRHKRVPGKVSMAAQGQRCTEHPCLRKGRSHNPQTLFQPLFYHTPPAPYSNVHRKSRYRSLDDYPRKRGVGL